MSPIPGSTLYTWEKATLGKGKAPFGDGKKCDNVKDRHRVATRVRKMVKEEVKYVIEVETY